MVIANSDSNSTLVSLNHAVKRVASLESLPVQHDQDLAVRQTSLFLPEEAALGLDDDSTSLFEDQVPIYLAATNSNNSSCEQQQPVVGVDEWLNCLPQVLDARDELLAVPPRRLGRFSSERILYVGQGEMAHAVPQQCDVIVSDRATTCHILAVRSTCSSSSPLVSLTHVDAPVYEDCIRAMMQRHKKHHHDSTTNKNDKIQLELHMIGGFEDAQGSSRAISNWLVHLLADLAEEYATEMKMTLRTCVISCLNETGHGSPAARGLAMDVRSGHVYAASCDAAVAGPSTILRAARLWSSQPSNNNTSSLSMIHDEQSDVLTIQPFQFGHFYNLDKLVQLPDHLLLKYCSTSPDCEQDDFCTTLRTTLQFLLTVNCQDVFGKACRQPLQYRRVACSNTWKRC